MGGSFLQIAMYVLAGSIVGAAAGAAIMAITARQRYSRIASESLAKLDEASRQRDGFAAEFARSRSKIESQQTRIGKVRGALEVANKQCKVLAKNVKALRAEREGTKVKLRTLQDSLVAVKQRTASLQQEFDKIGDFYKGELFKSLEKRKAVEEQLEAVRAEQESFAKLTEKSILEHGSPDEMIAAAQLRFGQLEVLERNINKLEDENGRLNDDAKHLRRENGELLRRLEEMDELKMYNQQLVRCVESLESSRKHHEKDAERYRDQAEQSEQLSDTLRLRLDDLEKNFADIEQQQRSALKHARDATTPTDREDAGGRSQVVDLASYSGKS